MRYVLVIYLVDNVEPVRLECDKDQCEKMFHQIMTDGAIVKRGSNLVYYPPQKIDYIKASPKR